MTSRPSVTPQTRGIKRSLSTESHEFSSPSIDRYPLDRHHHLATQQSRITQGSPALETLGATQ